MPPKRKEALVEALDRRNAAMHEAGHVVIAGEVAVEVWAACIYPVPSAWDDHLNKTTWNGETRFDRNASPQQLAKVCVAGAIAVLSWRREPAQQWPHFMKSRSDWDICGCQPGQATPELQEAAAAVYGLLNRETGALWYPLCKAARYLIKNPAPPLYNL